MRLFIGTLYSGENEFEECTRSIECQSYRDFDHFVYRNLPNREAHETLFSSFLRQGDQYNLLVKVDADMVLASDRLFERITQKFQQQPGLDIFSIAVLDFFSGQLINGLNTYRNTVRWDFGQNTLFVDIPLLTNAHYIYDDRELAPAAFHCKNPSAFQAFHYGIHRGLKSIAAQHSTAHWALLENTWQNFLRKKDVRIGLAVLGAELVYAGRFTKMNIDYNHPEGKIILARYEHMDASQLQREIRGLRLRYAGWLPGNLRRIILRKIRRSTGG